MHLTWIVLPLNALHIFLAHGLLNISILIPRIPVRNVVRSPLRRLGQRIGCSLSTRPLKILYRLVTHGRYNIQLRIWTRIIIVVDQGRTRLLRMQVLAGLTLALALALLFLKLGLIRDTVLGLAHARATDGISICLIYLADAHKDIKVFQFLMVLLLPFKHFVLKWILVSSNHVVPGLEEVIIESPSCSLTSISIST